ncbi:MAG: hypothetical protein NTX73_08625 [Rhodobacterales bacterium]|nr:hypothetical protein [Rhodobacterales bacterium]
MQRIATLAVLTLANCITEDPDPAATHAARDTCIAANVTASRTQLANAAVTDLTGASGGISVKLRFGSSTWSCLTDNAGRLSSHDGPALSSPRPSLA